MAQKKKGNVFVFVFVFVFVWLVGKFDVREAIKVGIIYTLMINLTLLVIAVIYLVIKNGKNVWILGLTMVLAPLLIAGIGIMVFQFLVDGKHNIFFCCCRTSSYNPMYDPELSLARSHQHSES